jgi:glucose-1-phosphatase
MIFASETGCNFTHFLRIEQKNLKSMIKNIIFDLGVVLLNIDFQKTMAAFKNLGIENIDEIFSGYSQSGFFDDFEKGLISPEEFREEIQKLLYDKVSDDQIDEAWNAMILEFPVDRINFVMGCRNNYRTFLLSNTNAIHFPVYNKQIQEKYLLHDLSDLFEKAYYSYRLDLRKPDKEIFELVINENSLVPEETLFIDDSPQHIATAASLGIKTFLFVPPATLKDALMAQ